MVNKILILPNYSAYRTSDGFMLEASYPLLLDDLTKNNLQVIVAAPVIETQYVVGNYAPFLGDGVSFISLIGSDACVSIFRKISNYLTLMPKLVRLIIKTDFCYIFSPGHTGLMAVFICLLLGKKYGLYLRGDWENATPRFLLFSKSIIFRNASFNICTGAKLADEVVQFNSRSYAVVPMLPLLSEGFLTNLAKRTDSHVFRILFVGQLISGKGIFDLIRALYLLKFKFQVKFVANVVGDGVDRKKLESSIQQYGLADSVKCVGVISKREDLANLYINSDVLSLPSHSEGFPRVIYEAMFFSLPIVCTNIGQIPSIILDGVNGIFHSAGDAEALAEALNKVAADAEFRNRLGCSGYATLNRLRRQWRYKSHGDQLYRLINAM